MRMPQLIFQQHQACCPSIVGTILTRTQSSVDQPNQYRDQLDADCADDAVVQFMVGLSYF